MNVDYFTGRTVESVEDIEGGGWRINFEGGGSIINYDETLGSPGEGIEQFSLNRVTMSGDSTTIYFGPKSNPLGTSINLNPLEYAITDPAFTEGQEVYPQRPAEVEDRIPPHPDERVADGPVKARPRREDR